MVSDTMLISIPLKGAAAFSNHCNSFSWSALDKVEGWNSLSIHFWIVASSAKAGTAIVMVAANSAAALVLARRPSLLLSKFRFCFLRLQRLKTFFFEHDHAPVPGPG